MTWEYEPQRHSLASYGIKTSINMTDVEKYDNYKTYNIYYENPKKIIKFLKNEFPKGKYVRFMNIDKDFDEKSFLNFQSYDNERIGSFVNCDVLKRYENGEISRKELLKLSMIPPHIHNHLKIVDGNRIKVNYDGIHAYSLEDVEYEPKQTLYTAMKYEDNIIVFDGERVGRNLWDDGYIVKPKDVKAIINLGGSIEFGRKY